MYVITDLTQFSKDGRVCMAAVNTETGRCIRPMPYLNQDNCRENRILPGSIISGDFESVPVIEPHIEDVRYGNLQHLGPCDALTFKKLLDLTRSNDLASGFDGPIDKKLNPESLPAKRSLITYKAGSVELVADGYKAGKLRVHFDGQSFVPVNDLGYVLDYGSRPNPDTIRLYNQFLKSQKEIYLRIGLTRIHGTEPRRGYWLQVNGVYTFPKRNSEVRRYV